MVRNALNTAFLPQIVTAALPGPKAAALIERDRAVLSPSYTRGYPLVADHAEGAMITDPDGNRFLDFNAGIAVVATGHCHPRVRKAIEEQSARLIHMSGTDFYYENMVVLAEKLASLAPGAKSEKRRVYFGNSGAEAVEAAMKLARYHTGRDQFIAFLGAFHGRTMGALSLTGSKVVQKKKFGPLVPGVTHIPYPNRLRPAYAGDPEAQGSACVRFIEDYLFKHTVPADEVAAIIVEPIQGEGGYLVPPPGFLAELQELARRYGILVIADEVQSGMGRTGRMFASEHFGFEPDIVTLAKGIASGLPLSGMIARDSVMQWKPGAHASTFGGNPVAIAASLATIALLEEELMANAARMGEHLMERIADWPKRFRHVLEVRGRGLMIGFEIVKDQESREKAPELRDRIEQMAFERGLLILGAGQNAIRLCPPLLINRDQADFAVDTIEECLRALEQ